MKQKTLSFSNIILFLLLLSSATFSQENYDQYIQQIESLPLDEKIKSLKSACWDFRSKDPRLALKYGKLLLSEIDNSGKLEEKPEALNYLGVVHSNIGKEDSAYFYYSLAHQLSEKLGIRHQIAYSLNNIGYYYFKNSLFPEALEKMYESYNIFEEEGDETGMAYVLNNVGELYLEQGDFQKALDNFYKSSELRFKNNDDRGYAKSLISISNIEIEKGDLDAATKNLSIALKHAEKNDYFKGVSNIKYAFSKIYFAQKKYDEALESGKASLKIDLEIGNIYGEIDNYNNIARIYFQLNKFTDAEKFALKAEKLSSKYEQLEKRIISNEILAAIFYKKKNYNNAYQYLMQKGELSEILTQKRNASKTSDLQIAFQVERKNRENELLKRDLEIQSIQIYFSLALLIIVIILIVGIITRYNEIKKRNKLLNEINQSKDKLFSIIAHDLKNPMGAMSNIADYLNTDFESIDADDVKKLIGSLSNSSQDINNLLNNLLNYARSQKGGLAANMKRVKLYELLASSIAPYSLLAKNKSIQIEIIADKEKTVLIDRFMVETIIGNLITNSIKYSKPKSKILLEGSVFKNMFMIIVQDFGVGMGQETIDQLLSSEFSDSQQGTKNEKGTGLGLRICRDFISMHNGTMEIESVKNQGSKFIVSLPQHSD